MNIFETIIVAIGLSVDAFAVAITGGLTARGLDFKNTLKMPFLFGLFQGGMIVAGWHLGRGFNSYISSFDHWIAFGLLVLIGLKMVLDSFQNKENGHADIFSWAVVLLLAVATSIDAFAVGLSYALLEHPFIFLSVITGIITFSLSLGGLESGKRGAHLGHGKVRLAGGIALIMIGLKILLEHF